MKKLVFFSGGTALAPLAAYLASRGVAPAYIITTFDSGGSTQAIRKVIDMPAVGDLRNRLLASVSPRFSLGAALSYLKFRLDGNQSFSQARGQLREMIQSSDMEDAEEWQFIKEDLETFITLIPKDFDARRASLGNLAITGNWLANGRSLSRAINRYRRILNVSASLIPVCEESLHLCTRLENGEICLGQHLLNKGLPAKIADIFLTRHTPWQSGLIWEGSDPNAEKSALEAISEADLICFPIGSFFSSLLATLLPRGIGRAIAASDAVKVFIPNSGFDNELSGITVLEQVEFLLHILHRDAPESAEENLLDFVLMDSQNGKYQMDSLSKLTQALTKYNISLLDKPLVGREGKHEAAALLHALEELA